MTLLDILLARFGLFLVPGRVARGMKPLASEVLSPRKAAQGHVLCYGLPGGTTPSKDEPKPMGPTPEKPGRPSGPCLAVRLSPQMRRVATPCVPTKSFAALRGLKPSGWQQTLGSSDSSAHALEVKLQSTVFEPSAPSFGTRCCAFGAEVKVQRALQAAVEAVVRREHMASP